MEFPTNEILSILENTADGAFVVDSNLQIQMWNKAAQELLGFDKDDAEGRFCYKIIKGMDEDQQLICCVHCQVSKLAMKSESVSSYDMQACTNEGEKRWLNMSILTLNLGPNGDNKMIAHLFRDITQKKTEQVFFRRFLETARRYQKISVDLDDDNNSHHPVEKLTSRQKEVLSLLSRGLSTKEIANILYTSPNTVRNHIQRILDKLQVHSRLEAVAYGRKNGLWD